MLNWYQAVELTLSFFVLEDLVTLGDCNYTETERGYDNQNFSQLTQIVASF